MNGSRKIACSMQAMAWIKRKRALLKVQSAMALTLTRATKLNRKTTEIKAIIRLCELICV